MWIHKPRWPVPASSHITPESVYRQRRHFMQAGLGAAVLGSGAAGLASTVRAAQNEGELPGTPAPQYSVNEKLTSWRDITTYNNFYEFGTGKEDPARFASRMKVRPWTLRVDGE